MNFIVITENDESEWDDRTGVRYHYPRKYKNKLQPGSYFVYYKGKQRKKQYADSRMSADPHYFGVGIIGNSFEDENSEKKDLFCEIIDFEPFDKGVIEVRGDQLVFLENVLMGTPSGTSTLVLGASSNGWVDWKTQDGKTLDAATKEAKASE